MDTQNRFRQPSSLGFPDVYDWMSHLRSTNTERIEYLSLNISHVNGDSLSLVANSGITGEMSMSLSWGNKIHFDLGKCFIGGGSEESLQQSLLPVFSNLCIRAFLKGVRRDIVKFLQFDEGLGIIESVKYKQAFNSLFAAACHSCLLYAKEYLNTKFSKFEISESEVQKLPSQTREEALLIIGPAATDRLMRSLSTNFTQIYLHRSNWREQENPFRISYCNLSIPGLWIINSYCPMVSMLRKGNVEIGNQATPITQGDKGLHYALCYQQLQCILQFRYEVTVYRDYIQVRLEIDNVRCDVIQLHHPDDPIPTRLQDERHFPAKISLNLGPHKKSHVHSVSLSASSQNPVTDIEKGKTYEAILEPSKYPGFKLSNTTTSSISMKNWDFEQSVVNGTDGHLEWTLYDSTTGKALLDNKPSKLSVLGFKIWSSDRYSKAHRAFTKQGGVVFAGDDYGQPITWRLNRDLEGQTLNWVVEGDICLAYFPNTQRTAHSETSSHHFCQLVKLPLVQSTLD